MTVVPYGRLPLSQRDVTYLHGPDSLERAEVERGTVEELFLAPSTRYPGTTRRVWVHCPVGKPTSDDTAVMFFNDGWWYLDPGGDVRGATVLDNLAAAGDVPTMVGVFVDPGVIDDEGRPIKHRNVEYDAFDDVYASFLLEEVLPGCRPVSRFRPTR